MAPLTHDGAGNLLNTNADTIAGETAKALAALFDVTLVFCFEKKGVLRDENDDDSVAGIEITITSHTTVTEEVLVFQVGSITPAEYLESDEIRLSGLQIRSQVEFGFELAIFAIAYITAVYPEIHIGGYRTEMSDNVFPFPVGGNNDFTTVRTYMIVLCRNFRRVVLELITPSITGVYINRIAITVQFPHSNT